MCGFVAAEEFLAVITKVDDGKVTYKRMKRVEGKKRVQYDEEAVLPIANKGKILELVINLDKEKKMTYEAGKELPKGLENAQLKEHLENPKLPLVAQIITDKSGKKIEELRVKVIPSKK
jgi:hypothetical protein